MRLQLAVPLFVGAVSLACSSAPNERIGTAAEDIINGTNSPSSQDMVVLVVHPAGPNGVYECSGTLLAPNLVLTARHCVSQTADQPFTCDSSGTGSSGGDVGADFTANTMYVFTGNQSPSNIDAPQARGKKLYHDNATNLCNHDLALILLSSSIKNAKIAPVRLASPPKLGETFTAVGWGVTTTSTSPPVRQQRANVRIEDVGPNGIDTPSNEFHIGEAICQGDSGGPALDTKTGAVLGVVSRGGNGQSGPPPNNCIGADNWYTQTTPFKSIILQAYSDAGQDPWYEGAPDPRLAKFGDACTQDSDCQSAICLTDSSGNQTCSSDCSQNPCPDGYDCVNNDSYGTQVCVVHQDPPPPKNNANPTKHGCAVSGGESGSSGGWIAMAAAALFARRRRASRWAKRSFRERAPSS